MPGVDFAKDNDFGPQFNDKFDFTLDFEHTILTTVPATLLIAAAPIFFFVYRGQDAIILNGKLLWAKLALAATLVVFETLNLALWSTLEHRNSDNAITAATLSCVAAISLVPILYLEHRHTLRSTAPVGAWLFLTVLCDLVKSRSLFLRDDGHIIGALTVVACALKACILALEEVSKKSLIKDEKVREDVGREAASGFLSRTLFLWIYQLFGYGFRNILSLDELDKLGPSFVTQRVADQLSQCWNTDDGHPPGSLIIACLRANLFALLGNVFPQLFHSAFTLTQPLLLRSVVRYTESSEKTPGQRDGLVVATVVIFIGIGLSKAAYTHMCNRIATRMRGMLAAEVSRKSLRIKYSEALKEDNITLLTTDVDTVSFMVPAFHHFWAYPIEIGINVYILSIIIKEASVLVIFPAIASALVGYHIGSKLPDARKLWTNFTASRVAKTSSILRNIKAIKMIGLEEVVSDYLQGLRNTEMEISLQSQVLVMLFFVVGTFCDCMTKPLVLAGGLFWTGLGGHFTPTNVFTSLAAVSLVGSTMAKLIESYYLFQNGRASMQRIRTFLDLEEFSDPRQTDAVTLNRSSEKDGIKENILDVEKQVSIELPNRIIEFLHAFIAVQGLNDPVLKDLTLAIDRRDVVMVIGPTASGKSTLLKVILGEVELLSGSVYVEPGNAGYCDQTAWIWNGTIQENIMGSSPVDMTWYDAVITCCLLKKDLEQLPLGDQTSVGSNGANLSGGQKQRVALARALMARKPFIVLDDIWSALDRKTAGDIIANLFGENGLLERCHSTVIMATHSVQFLEIATRVVILNRKGEATVETDISKVMQHDEVRKIVDAMENSSVASGEAELPSSRAAPAAQLTPPTVDEETDLRRQMGDATIYRFYARSFKAVRLLVFVLGTALTSFAEVFTDAFVRIWMEVDPENRLYFIGYATIASSPALFWWASIYWWLFKIVPFSAKILHRMLLDIVMRSTMHFLTSTDHGSLVNRFSLDMYLVSQILPMGFLRTCYYFFLLLARVAVIIAVTKYTGAAVPFFVFVIYVVQLVYLRTSRQLRQVDLETKGPLCAQFTESALGLQHIRALGWEHETIAKSYRLIDNAQKPHYHILAAERWLGLTMDTVSFLAAFVLVIVAVWLNHITTASGVGLSLLSLISLSFDATQFIDQWMKLESSLGALSRLKDMVQRTPLEEDPEDEAQLPDGWPYDGEIIIKDVTAHYDPHSEGPAILDDFSVEIPSQAKCGIVGRTGSGKSSIVMLLLGFMTYSGSITIDGVDISRVPPKKLRDAITTITQENLDFDGTVRDNLYPWARVSSKHKDKLNPLAVGGLLDRLGLLHLLGEDGEKLDSEMSSLGLSYGQKQLMGIARSCLRHLSNNTRIIVMDEATSSLDHETEAMVLQVFKEIFYDCTILTVAHRTETLQEYPMILNVADGRVTLNKRPETPQPSAAEATSDAAQQLGAKLPPSPSVLPPSPSVLPPYPSEQTEPFVLPNRLISGAEFKRLSENATEEQILQLAALVDLGPPDQFYNAPPPKLPKPKYPPGLKKWNPADHYGPTDVSPSYDSSQDNAGSPRLSTSSNRFTGYPVADAGPSSAIPQPTSPQVNPGSPRLSTSSNRSARYPAAEAGPSNASSPRTSSQSFRRVTGPYSPENLHLLYPVGHPAHAAASIPIQVDPESNTEHARPTGPVPMSPIFDFWLQQSERSRLRNEEIIANGKLIERARERMERTRQHFLWEDAQRAKKKAKEKAKQEAKQVKSEEKQARKEGQKKVQTETGESSAAGARKLESKPKVTPTQTEAGEGPSAQNPKR